MKVKDIVSEPLEIHNIGNSLERRKIVFDAISLEGSLNARNHLGGTSPKQVSLAIKAGRKSIK